MEKEREREKRRERENEVIHLFPNSYISFVLMSCSGRLAPPPPPPPPPRGDTLHFTQSHRHPQVRILPKPLI